MSQPLVGECIEAWRALTSGNWDALQGDAPNALCEGAIHFARVVESYQAWDLREKAKKREAERNGR